jgi:flagellar hook-basal body complex protein FliE
LSGAEVSYVPLKKSSKSSKGTSRSFGRLLSNAIEDVQLDIDRAVAERTQREEAQLEARRLMNGIRTEITGGDDG